MILVSSGLDTVGDPIPASGRYSLRLAAKLRGGSAKLQINIIVDSVAQKHSPAVLPSNQLFFCDVQNRFTICKMCADQWRERSGKESGCPVF